jgi:hypothetical protein
VYEVRLNHHAVTSKDLLSIDLKGKIHTRVSQLKDQFTQKFYKSHERLLELSTKLTRLEEQIADKSDDQLNLSSKLKGLNAEHAAERDVWDNLLFYFSFYFLYFLGLDLYSFFLLIILFFIEYLKTLFILEMECKTFKNTSGNRANCRRYTENARANPECS